MIIKRIKFRNFKSYGNKLQQIDFNDKSSLILLTGTNGYGKSSILETISLSIFGTVNGKTGKKIPLTDLPNRINKSLFVSTEFFNNNNDYIIMEREISPNRLNIKVNDESYTERFKLMTPEQKEVLIGTNYNTFKSFISLDLNTFNDFISLKPETKRNLLNKLFNLEEIDEYYQTTKELINQNKKEIDRLIVENSSIDKKLSEYKAIIQDNNTVVTISKDEIKSKMKSKKEIYDNKKTELKTITDKISDFSVSIQESKNNSDMLDKENYKRRIDLNDINDKIKIHEEGNCPYCLSDLKSEEHIKLLTELKLKSTDLKEKILLNTNKINIYNDKTYDLTNQRSILNSSLNQLNNDLMNMKSELLSLKNSYDNYVEPTANNIIADIKKQGKLLLSDKEKNSNRIQLLKSENVSLNTLKDILSEDGVRKGIITSMVVPINQKLKKYLEFINFPYDVELDDNFDAIVYERGISINHETISNGEARMLNLCIAIAYIDMIIKNNEINILFMDEVFSSIQIDNISMLVKLLRTFSTENNISLILVHHGLEQLDSKLFDKIITVDKQLFSDLKIN